MTDTLTVQQAGLAIDYAAKFLHNVFDEKLTQMGYPDFAFDAVATGLFSYLLSRDFVVSRHYREPHGCY